jgi:hypothetical protein
VFVGDVNLDIFWRMENVSAILLIKRLTKMEFALLARFWVVRLVNLMMIANVGLAMMERNLLIMGAIVRKVERHRMRKASAQHVLLLGACHVRLKTLINVSHVLPTSICKAGYAVVQIQDKK